uniref:Uncharacterized protein n=1 Tax=Acrobeloides nanus TaxID=290746 RepID=A0A914EM52_9BILA
MKHIVAEWSDCKLVHGKPKLLQSQGSGERANLNVKTTAASAAETKESVIASAMEVEAARTFIMIINNSFVLCPCPFVIGYVL